MAYSSSPMIVTQRLDDDDKSGGDDEEMQLGAVTTIAYRPDVERLPSFTEVDADGNGEIEFEEFKNYFNMTEEEAEKIFRETDINQDGKLDRDEYLTFKMRAFDFARAVILPKSRRTQHRKLSYKDQYSCFPPPIFMFTITLIEIGFFIYHAIRLVNDPKHGSIERYRPAPIDSNLIYDPQRRNQLWRFVTYMLVHSGYMHIINNVLMQLLLGVLLEMVHKWWRVLAIYFGGVLAGSLATSIAEPYNYLAGASGGVYALIAAHLSTVILNWTEMEYPWVRVVLFGVFAAYDVGMALYYSYVMELSTSVGYAAHLGGFCAGLLIGIYVLKNLRWVQWECVLWYLSVVALVLLTLFAVAWNVFKKDYFPPTKCDEGILAAFC
ncbi:Rhomboid-related protein 3 [Orchesella cincta]|uniref:Rhomboid-related protein 3 n=1 Tax=Orchesella cincta TaxID=48709 RepID=A0A1D2N6C3_ORCCI|nr:Rhomboid-related protein 3 [Orchesella cincta]